MVEIIHKSTQKARKEYYDNGWEFIEEWLSQTGGELFTDIRSPRKWITYAEAKILYLHKKREKPHKILKGEMYERQFNKDNGDKWVFRTNSNLVPILEKYGKEIYPYI